MEDDNIDNQAHKYFTHPEKPGVICVPVADVDTEGMFCFFAQFIRVASESDEWSVLFPDLPGCLTCGHGLKQAMANAMDVLGGWISLVKELGLQIPEPSDLAAARAKAELENAEAGVISNNDTLYLLVPAWLVQN